MLIPNHIARVTTATEWLGLRIAHLCRRAESFP
jgi:hypothetical protein